MSSKFSETSFFLGGRSVQSVGEGTGDGVKIYFLSKTQPKSHLSDKKSSILYPKHATFYIFRKENQVESVFEGFLWQGEILLGAKRNADSSRVTVKPKRQK